MNTVNTVAQRASSGLILLSILLIVVGLLALFLVAATSLGVVIVIGWLLLLHGCVQLVHSFRSAGIGHIVWKVLVAVLYLSAGAYLIAHPALGAAALTLLLGMFLVTEGLADIITYFSTRRLRRSRWVLVDGTINLLLGAMIWNSWPSSSLWVIGTLVAFSMLMTGTTRLMMALAVRTLARDPRSVPVGRAA
jgi:uncharacterized membrane protein HdeD (DUF308 family)